MSGSSLPSAPFVTVSLTPPNTLTLAHRHDAPASPALPLKENQKNKILAIIFGTLAALGIATMIVLAVPGVNILSWKISLGVSLGLAVIIAGSIYFSRANPPQQGGGSASSSAALPAPVAPIVAKVRTPQEMAERTQLGKAIRANFSQLVTAFVPEEIPGYPGIFSESPAGELGHALGSGLIQFIALTTLNAETMQKYVQDIKQDRDGLLGLFTLEDFECLSEMLKPYWQIMQATIKGVRPSVTVTERESLALSAIALPDEVLGTLGVYLECHPRLSKRCKAFIASLTKPIDSEVAVASPQQSGASASSSAALPAPVPSIAAKGRTPQQIAERVQLGKTVKANFNRLMRDFKPEQIPGTRNFSQPPSEILGWIVDSGLAATFLYLPTLNADSMQNYVQEIKQAQVLPQNLKDIAGAFDLFTLEDFEFLAKMLISYKLIWEDAQKASLNGMQKPEQAPEVVKLGLLAIDLPDEVLGTLFLYLERQPVLFMDRKPFIASLKEPVEG